MKRTDVLSHSIFQRVPESQTIPHPTCRTRDSGSFSESGRRSSIQFAHLRSSQSTANVPHKSSENGHHATSANLAPVSDVLTSQQKDHTDLKPPQLPFGENVAVATGTAAAQ
jgi:poly(A) polymerase